VLVTKRTPDVLEKRYTAEQVKGWVEEDLARLFAPWLVGRAETYVPDPATKQLVALGYWLREELSLVCNETDTRTQLSKFNRLSRTYDVWETAAECMNDVLDGKVEQGRRPHRRWG
jgi:hypothetical protein